MASEELVPESEPHIYKIACSHYPEIFELDKSVCKGYFRQFGKVLRLIFKPRQRVIIAQYVNKNDYFNALAGPSEYEGQPFKVEPFESSVPMPGRPDSDPLFKKRGREKVTKKYKLVYLAPEKSTKTRKATYIDKEELTDELEAMAGYSNVKDIIDLTSEEVASHRKPKIIPKLNRVWKKTSQVTTTVPVEQPKNIIKVHKKKAKQKNKILTAEQLELLKIIKSQATTIDEKYKLLDARDKLLRSNKKKSSLKYTPTLGTCPDMCPEKERLLREIQHQVSMYEQDGTGRHSMSQVKAVKQYSRSSADQESPLAHDLRPASVLQMTMTYLMYNIMDLDENDADVNIGEWFHFLWDRTRGIRKDITQQALCSLGSVELVEQCARFHIHCSARFMGEDPSIFDQKINTENLTKCLQTLKYMYHDLELKEEKCPNESEFRAYIILLNLSDGNFMWEVQNLRPEIQKSPEVKFALQIYSAFEKRQFVKFFKLIRSTTYLNACILMRYFVQVRLQAIESLIKCFTPPKSISFYPVDELAYLLLFDDLESTIDFMKTFGIGLNKDSTNFMIDRNTFCMPEYPYILERSKCVEEKRHLSVGAVVNGSEISPELYMEVQSHEVHNSFDKDGYLIQDEIFNEMEMGIEERLLDEVDSRL